MRQIKDYNLIRQNGNYYIANIPAYAKLLHVGYNRHEDCPTITVLFDEGTTTVIKHVFVSFYDGQSVHDGCEYVGTFVDPQPYHLVHVFKYTTLIEIP
jgi:hypothetical protein